MAGAAPVLHHHGDLVVGLQVQLLGLVQDLGGEGTQRREKRGEVERGGKPGGRMKGHGALNDLA
jgi:hypothetical protein